MYIKTLEWYTFAYSKVPLPPIITNHDAVTTHHPLQSKSQVTELYFLCFEVMGPINDLVNI